MTRAFPEEAAPERPESSSPRRRGRERERADIFERYGTVQGGPVRAFLRVPLFVKILAANATLVVLGALIGTWLTAESIRADPGRSTLELIALLGSVGIALSLIVNAVILKLALTPLRELEDAARRVGDGDLEARAPVSPLADRELERLVHTFNTMLDALAGYRERVRLVARRALHAAEEERGRIARELHDETAQTLAALLIRLKTLREQDDPEARVAAIAELREQVSASLEGVRRYLQALRPPALDELGLGPALEVLIREVEERHGLRIDLEIDPLADRLSSDAELVVYRIVQEALSNVVRHANAGTVRIRLERLEGLVALIVSDDGRGFQSVDVTAEDGRGLGLEGMKERAATVGGWLRIESEPGTGTTVRAYLPIDSDG